MKFINGKLLLLLILSTIGSITAFSQELSDGCQVVEVNRTKIALKDLAEIVGGEEKLFEEIWSIEPEKFVLCVPQNESERIIKKPPSKVLYENVDEYQLQRSAGKAEELKKEWKHLRGVKFWWGSSNEPSETFRQEKIDFLKNIGVRVQRSDKCYFSETLGLWRCYFEAVAPKETMKDIKKECHCIVSEKPVIARIILDTPEKWEKLRQSNISFIDDPGLTRIKESEIMTFIPYDRTVQIEELGIEVQFNQITLLQQIGTYNHRYMD